MKTAIADVEQCPINLAQMVIGGKWKISIIWRIGQRTHRFSELKRALPGITQKMLTQQLRELEEHQIIRRQVYAVVPPKVEYSLTGIGAKLIPILEQMCSWGFDYLEQTAALADAAVTAPGA